MDGERNIGGFGNTAINKEFSQFDWFADKIYQNEIKKSNRQWIKPTSKDPYYFLIPKNPNDWIDINCLKVWGNLKVVWDDGGVEKAPLGDVHKWSLVNNIYHALWKKITIKANGNEFEDTAAAHYPWKSYIQNKLNVSPNFKKKVWYHNNAWIEDDHGKGDKMGPTVLDKYTKKGPPSSTEILEDLYNADYNSGFVNRRNKIKNGNSNPFEITIYHDLMTSGKAFPPNTEFEIILERTDDKFLFIQGTEEDKKFKIVLENIMISYDHKIVTDQVKQYHDRKSKNTLPYATVKKNFLKYYVIQAGDTDMSKSPMFYSSGALPEQIIIFFLPQKVFEGKLDSNPYYWKPYEFEEIALVVNGYNEPSKYLKSITDMDKLILYNHFLENTGYGPDRDMANDVPVSYEDYFKNSFMLAFDRTASKHNGYYQTIPDTGTIDIHLKLKDPLQGTDNMVVCVYASYSEDIKIDGDRIYFSPMETRMEE